MNIITGKDDVTGSSGFTDFKRPRYFYTTVSNGKFLIDYVNLNTIYFSKFEISLYKISLQTTKLIIKM
jgi:hypothetical protein